MTVPGNKLVPYDIGSPAPTPTLATLATPTAPAAPIGNDAATEAAYTTISNIGLPALGAGNAVTIDGTFVRPDLVAYDKRYTDAFAQTRSGIANQLSRSLTDIQTQEGLANQAIATLDPRYKDIFGQATSNAERFAQSQAQAAQGLGLSGANATVDANMLAALGGAQGAFTASTGMVGIGSQQMHNQARGRMEQANLGALSDIGQKEAEWIGKRAELDTRINEAENNWNNQQKQMKLEAERDRQRMESERAQLAQQRALAQADITSRERGQRADRAESRASRESAKKAERDPIADYRKKVEIDREFAAPPPDPQADNKVLARQVLDQTHGGHSSDRGRALMTFGYGQQVHGQEGYKNLSDFVAKKGGADWFQRDPAKAQAEIMKFSKPHWDPDTLSIFLAEIEAGKQPQAKPGKKKATPAAPPRKPGAWGRGPGS